MLVPDYPYCRQCSKLEQIPIDQGDPLPGKREGSYHLGNEELWSSWTWGLLSCLLYEGLASSELRRRCC